MRCVAACIMLCLQTLPSVANTLDFGSNLASITSEAGSLLHTAFHVLSLSSYFHSLISFPALSKTSIRMDEFLLSSVPVHTQQLTVDAPIETCNC